MENDPIYGSLRQHQADLRTIAKAIVEGRWTKRIVQAFIAPGSGKTRGASIFATELLAAGIVDRVLWIVPRDNLRQQVVRDFHSPEHGLRFFVQTAKGSRWPGSRQICLDGNVAAGVVATCQTICVDGAKAARWVGSLRTLVILDEGHHLAENGLADTESDEGAWTPHMQRVVDAAAWVLDMSGTPVRHAGGRIAFLSYDETTKTPIFDVKYTRRDAIAEHAVLPIEFRRLDGVAKYQHLSRDHEVEISKATGKAAKHALRSAMDEGSDYRDDAVMEAMRHWKAYRTSAYASRVIIVADTQKAARHYATLVRREFHVDVALAISDDKDSPRRIQRFREHPEEFHVLVTVGMAHEGLDVPDCTHLICLTRYRSRPWLEQAFARVTRFNAKCGLPWSEQIAYIFVPDDIANIRTSVPGPNSARVSPLRTRSMYGSWPS